MIRGGGDSFMNYTQYKFARDLAWKILIRERVCALPVSMSGLCRQMGIEVKYDDKERCIFLADSSADNPIVSSSKKKKMPKERDTCS